MTKERQPEFAAQVVRCLEEGVDTPALHAAASCAIELSGVMGSGIGCSPSPKRS